MDMLEADTSYERNYINVLACINPVRRAVETKIFTAGI